MKTLEEIKELQQWQNDFDEWIKVAPEITGREGYSTWDWNIMRGAYLAGRKKAKVDDQFLELQLSSALSAVNSFRREEKLHGLFQAKIFMKSVAGNNDYSMFINEAPFGGFKWNFLDFEPEDKENYSPLFVHNFMVQDLEIIFDIIKSAMKDAEKTYDKDWIEVEGTTTNDWYSKAKGMFNE